jgi:hypothetical protein
MVVGMAALLLASLPVLLAMLSVLPVLAVLLAVLAMADMTGRWLAGGRLGLRGYRNGDGKRHRREEDRLHFRSSVEREWFATLFRQERGGGMAASTARP